MTEQSLLFIFPRGKASWKRELERNGLELMRRPYSRKSRDDVPIKQKRRKEIVKPLRHMHP